MRGINLPIFKTKTGGPVFKLEDPNERRKYFDHKAGPEIQKLREFLKNNTLMAILLGPKNSGKGTYTKLFIEALGTDRVAHISIGDIVRSVHKDLGDESKKAELIEFLKKRYRGFLSVDDVVASILGRGTQKLLPTEAMLALIEREIDNIGGRKAVFVDGFPRDLDQVSYSIFFRSLMGYRDDPDFFVFIDVPEAVIDERMKYRVICPKCQTPRNLKLLRTKEIGYDTGQKKFFLVCDNAGCAGGRMVSKEGDELGIEAIRNRIEADGKVMKTLLGLQGVPQVFLRNSIPVSAAEEYVDNYEITPAYRYELDSSVTGSVKVIEEPWTVNDDLNLPSFSLLPAPVAVALIKQIASALGL